MESQPLPALRPLRLGELLDQAIRLYRRNFVTFIGIVALVYVPLMVLQTAVTALTSTSMMRSISESNSPQQLFTNYAYLASLLSSFVIIILRFIFVQGIATGALTRAVADNYLGKTTSILDAYRGIGKSWFTLLGALAFILLVALIIILWSVVPCIGTFTSPGMLLFLFVAINPLIAPVVVLEGQGIVNSIQRAWSLVRRRFWSVLLYVFILSLFSLLIVYGPTAIVNVILASFAPSFGDRNLQIVVTAIIQALVSIVFIVIYYPLQMTAFTLIYFDLRVRTEGFDLVLLTSNDANQALATPAKRSNENIVTGTDLGNFAILTLATAGICIFSYAFLFGGIFYLSNLFN